MDTRSMLLMVSRRLIENEELLCRLDSQIGDGDHGLTISRGFGAVLGKIEETASGTAAELFILTGETLQDVMGGAIGPVLGSFFTAMGESPACDGEIDTGKMSLMLREGLECVKCTGDVKPGDRTLVDALEPAVIALEGEAVLGTPLPRAMVRAAEAAKNGAMETKNMIAKKGRAKFLREKSLGYQDAGATSLSIIFSAMSEFFLTGNKAGSVCL
ncbi:MAG: dihydroxyacetone kinase subunit L [Treponema sp.]|jgi:dihydroxyacetone kinase phosphoprotein-dependent L subunit|nr:dihydroxyacetone kinase subunit L [Treponema sp.]